MNEINLQLSRDSKFEVPKSFGLPLLRYLPITIIMNSSRSDIYSSEDLVLIKLPLTYSFNRRFIAYVIKNNV